MLQQHNVLFLTAAHPRLKLEGPALAVRVSSATVLVSVTAGASDKRIVLKFSGNFSTARPFYVKSRAIGCPALYFIGRPIGVAISFAKSTPS